MSEWVVLAFSLLVVLAVAGLVVLSIRLVRATRQPPRPGRNEHDS